MESKRADIRKLYKDMRESIGELEDLKKLKDIAEVGSCYRWACWLAKDCRKLLELKIPKEFNSVEEWQNRN